MLRCKSRGFPIAAAVVLAVVFQCSVLRAQFSSQIEGTVMDPSQAAVPRATLTLLNVGTGISTSVQTSATGYYRLPSLPAAAFKLTASAPGFKTTEVSDLRLEVGQTRTINVTLEVGATATTITVEAQLSAVELSEARVSNVIESKQFTELPLLGRNFLALVALTAGVTGSTSMRRTRSPRT